MKFAILGKARSGKDTVAEHLITNYGFKRFYFAKGIEEIINKYFSETIGGPKPREHYQHIGQELRKLNPNVWINYLNKEVEEYLAEDRNANVVITDVRQANEVMNLRKQGYLIIKVVCREDIRIERMRSAGEVILDEYLNHDTEKQVDLAIPDLVLDNNGTVEELIRGVEAIMHLALKGGSQWGY